jgi:hypothetical protein
VERMYRLGLPNRIKVVASHEGNRRDIED